MSKWRIQLFDTVKYFSVKNKKIHACSIKGKTKLRDICSPAEMDSLCTSTHSLHEPFKRVWDNTYKKNSKIVDLFRTMVLLTNRLFKGILTVCSTNSCQLLPVIKWGTEAYTENACIEQSLLSRHCKIHKLFTDTASDCGWRQVQVFIGQCWQNYQ